MGLLFGQNTVPGHRLEDWSLVHDVGMGKNPAIRMVLERIGVMLQVAVLSEEEIDPIVPMLRAMLRVKAVYDPAPDSEAQLKKSLQQKCIMIERPRLDPLQWGAKWEIMVEQQGLATQP